ncbi:MAG: hypothetical protein M5U26_09605 [Planctomycetota bacterium]|nr:hypothetical protein [Planctomycetota bacterium]
MHPNAPSAARQSLLLALTLFLSGACALASEPLIKVVAEGGNAEGMNLTGSWEAVPEGPRGGKALKFDGSFSGRLDLKALSVEAREYDFIKLDVKADRAAQLVVSLENYPFEGALCHWYVLDGMRGPFDWRTIWIDLRQPEELKLAGQGKGMDASVPDARGLRLSGGTADTRRAIQEPGENVWLGAIRFVKQAVSLDWDQRLAPYTWGKGQDLVFTYPLRIANRLDRPLSAKLKLAPFRAEHARAELEAETVALGPKETKTVAARIVLPAEAAAAREPLYCEFFEARAEAEGLPDSEVTILRSSDPIHLSVTVPIPEEKLAYPLLGRRKDLPEYVTGYPGRGGPDAVKAAFEAGRPEDLEDVLRYGGLEMTSAWLATHNAIRKHCAAPLYADGFKQAQATGAKYENALTAAAFLYEGTGRRDTSKRPGRFCSRPPNSGLASRPPATRAPSSSSAKACWPTTRCIWASMSAAPRVRLTGTNATARSTTSTSSPGIWMKPRGRRSWRSSSSRRGSRRATTTSARAIRPAPPTT